jgi:hypothetical protein
MSKATPPNHPNPDLHNELVEAVEDGTLTPRETQPQHSAKYRV